MVHIAYILIQLAQLLPLPTQEAETFSPEALREDFAIFRQALTEAHPGIYRYTDKAYFDRQFEAIETSLGAEMTELDFFRMLNPLVARIHCGHTKFHRKDRPDDFYAFYDEGLFPLKLHFSPRGVYVLDSFSDQEGIAPGARVTAINGRNIGEIQGQLFENIYTDGQVQSTKFQELNQNFAGYYATFLGKASQFEVRYLSPGNGRPGNVTLKPVTRQELTGREQQRDTAGPFGLSFPAPGVALLRIGVFMPGEQGPDFEEFLQASFEEVLGAGTSHLILDLRGNQGGIDAWGKKLYAYLTNQPFPYYRCLRVATDQPFSFADYAWLPPNLDALRGFIEKSGEHYLFTMNENLGTQQPVANPYLGAVYILQDGLSYSVTSEFAAIARDQGRATFIGEENGGALGGNNSGAFAVVTLPHTGLTLGIPLVAYYMALEGQYPAERGVLPEYEITPTVPDLLEGRDVAMETALGLCQP